MAKKTNKSKQSKAMDLNVNMNIGAEVVSILPKLEELYTEFGGNMDIVMEEVEDHLLTVLKFYLEDFEQEKLENILKKSVNKSA